MYQAERLCKNIKKYRQKKGLTQGELAEKLFVSPQSVSKWECGLSTPDLANLYQLSAVLNVSVDTLLGNSKFLAEGKVCIGIDGGGTKTEFALFTETGHILRRLVLEGTNPNTTGLEKACEILKSGIDTLLAVTSEVSSVFAGISGYSSGDNGPKIAKFLKENYPHIKVKSGTDILNVTASAEGVTDCIAVICGTGSVVFASKNDTLHRFGGWGHLLDGAGSGYDLGKDALRAALQEAEGYGKKTLLTQLIERRLEGGVWRNIHEIYSGGKSYIASFAPLVLEAAEQGDGVAKEILNTNAAYLATLISLAENTYHTGKTVVLAGSILEKGTAFLACIKAHLEKDFQFVEPKLPQIYGACVRALGQIGTKNEGFFETFQKEYEECISC